MEDKNFYPFKESSEFEREFEFDESDWAAVSSKLDKIEQEKRRPIAGWWWLAAAAAIIPLLLGNVWFYQNMQKGQAIQEDMKTEIEHLSAQIVAKTDTIIRTEYVYVHDTIENTKIVYQDRFIPSSHARTYPMNNHGIFASSEPLLKTEFSVAIPPTSMGILLTKERLKKKNAASLQAIAKASKDGTENNQDYLNQNNLDKELSIIAAHKTLDALPIHDYKLLTSPGHHLEAWEDIWDLDIQVKSRKRPLAQLQAALQPSGFAVGLTGASLLPLAKNLEEKNGYSFGLTAELVFSGNMHLWAEATNTTLNYNSSIMDSALGIPVVTSPGDDYVFEDAKVSRKFNTYTMGLKHIWNKNGKWRPFANLGYGITQILPYQVIYDFHNEVAEDVDIKLERDIEEETVLKNFLHAGLGLEYVLKDDWRFSISGFYRGQLDKTSVFIPDYSSIKTSVIYQF